MWLGKIIGGLAGFSFGGPLGAILGVVLGHTFDRGLKLNLQANNRSGFGGVNDAGWQEQSDRPLPEGEIQAAFFEATFLVMGKIAKSDGQVSTEEIALAQSLMDQLQLSPSMKRHAIELFTQGKQDDFDMMPVLERFHVLSGRRTNLIQMFMEVQCQAAYADGELHDSELELIERVASILHYPSRNLEQILRRCQAFYSSSHPGGHSVDELANAYQVLGVEAKTSDAELKRAYRRLMSQHHPDKLVAKGLPEEMMAIATEKTQQISTAYELVTNHRKNNK